MATLSTRTAGAQRERQTARWLALVLRVGVLLAALCIVIGVALAVRGGHGEPSSLDAALGRGAARPHLSPIAILHGLARGDAPAAIELGLLVLILTPTLRVAMTAGLFARERDHLFAALAGAVLVVLLLGLAGIGA